ncbi:hypothetical protein EfmJHP80_24980 [Enterococcus faecium]|nr:hypothetical protein EfmJHP80_24980 [Enterococcus faecium]
MEKLISFLICMAVAMMIYNITEWTISMLAKIPHDARFILLSAILTLVLYKNTKVSNE